MEEKTQQWTLCTWNIDQKNSLKKMKLNLLNLHLKWTAYRMPNHGNIFYWMNPDDGLWLCWFGVEGCEWEMKLLQQRSADTQQTHSCLAAWPFVFHHANTTVGKIYRLHTAARKSYLIYQKVYQKNICHLSQIIKKQWNHNLNVHISLTQQLSAKLRSIYQ